MNVSQVNNVSFGNTKVLKKSTEIIIHDIRTVSTTTPKNINRLFLQKQSILRNLNYEDWDFDGWNDSRNGSDDNYFWKKNPFRKKKSEANDIITSTAMASGFIGATTAQMAGIDAAGVAVAVGIMCTKISNLYGVSLDSAVLDSLKQSFWGYGYAKLAGSISGVIPIVGNIINGATDAYITKQIGEKLTNLFEKAEERSRRELELHEKINGILQENEKLKKRNELMNKALAELAEEERKKNNKK